MKEKPPKVLENVLRHKHFTDVWISGGSDHVTERSVQVDYLETPNGARDFWVDVHVRERAIKNDKQVDPR